MKRKRWFAAIGLIVAIAAITPAYVRVYVVAGPSDAPSFLVGERVLLLKAAYDVRVPYTDVVIASHADPGRGDVVMYVPPGEDYTVFKRVIGCPGDIVVIRDNQLEINGVPMQYERVDGNAYRTVAERNSLGAVIEEESGNGPAHLITRTPGRGSGMSSAPVRVEEDHYYVIGDNRDNSLDSRAYGAIRRDAILGKVVRAYRSAP